MVSRSPLLFVLPIDSMDPCFAKSYFRNSRWISGHLLHQRVDWEEPAPVRSRLQQVEIFETAIFLSFFPPQEIHQLQGERHVKILKIACDEQ